MALTKAIVLDATVGNAGAGAAPGDSTDSVAGTFQSLREGTLLKCWGQNSGSVGVAGGTVILLQGAFQATRKHLSEDNSFSNIPRFMTQTNTTFFASISLSVWSTHGFLQKEWEQSGYRAVPPSRTPDLQDKSVNGEPTHQKQNQDFWGGAWCLHSNKLPEDAGVAEFEF